MIRPLELMWQQVHQEREDSDSAFFLSLMHLGEMTTKVVVAGLVSGIQDDRDRSRYQQLFALVRYDGIGDWTRMLDEVLTGPAAQFLRQELRSESRELTEKCAAGSWQYEAVSLLHNCLRLIEPTAEGLPVRPDLRRWFRDFARFRNKTTGHGAQKSGKLSTLCADLERSLRIISDSFSLFRREWAMLHRNLSGKYRVTRLSDSISQFEHLKASKTENWQNGIYFYAGGPIRVELMQATPMADDFYLPNGAFNEKRFEMISYISDDRIEADASPYSDTPGPLPRSETEGIGLLDSQGECFGNLPPRPATYVPRRALESELKGLLSDDQHNIITLHGMGGIGKTSLALTVIHELTTSKRYDVMVWFSARDIDLLPEGPKRVKPGVLDVDDVAREYSRLVSPSESSEKSFKARDYLAKSLAKTEIGPTLFVLDNFETVTNPVDFFKWIDTHIRAPNKVLITARHRHFKGDYPVEVSGMTGAESELLIKSTAERFGISHLVTRDLQQELIRESNGHPYAIKILIGEMARSHKLGKIRRVLAARDDILTALFERTYADLSPAAQHVFLTLCNWRATVPLLALEAVMLRPSNESIDVEEAVDELRRASFLDDIESPSDQQRFLSVPLVTTEFGRRKLKVSPMKAAIETDTEMLQQFGAGVPADVRHGVAPRIEQLFKYVASKIQSGTPPDEFASILEFIAGRYPRAWLLVARLAEESGSAGSDERAKEAIRRFLETASSNEAYQEWRHLAELCARTKDALGEAHALVERCQLAEASFQDLSYTARRLNTLKTGPSGLGFDEKRTLIERLIDLMEKRTAEANATDLSRMAWLHLHLDNEKRAKEHVSRGLEMESDNEYCRGLAERLRMDR
jgi:NB-ARC domain